MARTWRPRGKKRGPAPDPEVDALSGRRVLRDCYIARRRFQSAKSHIDRRLSWVLSVALLRTVGHVVRNVDGARSVYLKEAVRERYLHWKAEPFQHLIFHEFIEKERNNTLKEYRMDSAVVAGTEEADIPESYLLVGDLTLTPDQALGEAIAWWEHQLDAVEDGAGATRTQSGAGKLSSGSGRRGRSARAK